MPTRIPTITTLAIAAAAGGLLLAPLVGSRPVGATDAETQTSEAPRTGTVEQAKEAARKAAEEARQQVQALKTQTQEKVSAAKEKLEAAKLRVCQSREKNMTTRMTNLATRSEKQLAVFDAIAERVQSFKTDNNLTVDNYEGLMADIQAKRTAAEDMIKKLRDTSETFTCEGDSPKALAQGFVSNVRLKNEALKAYRTSVKNLITAVKTAAGKTGSNSGTSVEGGRQ